MCYIIAARNGYALFIILSHYFSNIIAKQHRPKYKLNP